MKAIDMDVVEAIAHEVAAEVGELRYNLWFKDNARMELGDSELVVGVPNLFFQEWLSSNFLLPLRRAAERATGRRLPVRFVVSGEMLRATRDGGRDSPAKPCKPAAEPAPPPNRTSRRGQTLENFVVGPCNRMAHAAALRIVHEPATQFNPLVFYGSMGLGKTHLLRGIAHAVRERHRTLQVLYLPAEAFTNSFLEDMRGGRLALFRQRLRSADLLLVDDLQFMESKRATQAELLHTYESLDADGKQVVLAADSHPRLIKGISDQLLDRLAAGMACPLEAPDFETRLAILDSKARALALSLSPEVLEFAADQFRSNVRELEGALNRLKATAELTPAPVTLEQARQALADLLRHRSKPGDLREVVQAICATFELDPDQLRSADRSRAISQPRMLAMYLARKHTGAAYDAIGNHFGGRNHSTVMFAERKVQSWIEEGAVIRVAGRSWSIVDAIRAIEQRLR